MLPVDAITLSAAALTGFFGSGHCVAMCGGVATGLATQRGQASFSTALQLNLGRLSGYAIAGAIAGGLGGGLLFIARNETLALMSRTALGTVMLIIAARLLWPRRFGFINRAGGGIWSRLQPLQQRLTPHAGRFKPWLLGLFWGWLPCGLSSTVLTAAWLEASALHGSLVMLAFGLGTLITMLPLSWSGARLRSVFAHPRWTYAFAGFIASAGVLTLIAPWLALNPNLHAALRALGCRSI